MNAYLQRLAMRSTGLAAHGQAVPRLKPPPATDDLGTFEIRSEFPASPPEFTAPSANLVRPTGEGATASEATEPAGSAYSSKPSNIRSTEPQTPGRDADETEALTLRTAAAPAPDLVSTNAPRTAHGALDLPTEAPAAELRAAIGERRAEHKRFDNPKATAARLQLDEEVAGKRERTPANRGERNDHSPPSNRPAHTPPAPRAPNVRPSRSADQVSSPSRTHVRVQAVTRASPEPTPNPLPKPVALPVLFPRERQTVPPNIAPLRAHEQEPAGGDSPVEISIGHIEVRLTEPQQQTERAQPKRNSLAGYANMRRHRDHRWY